MNRSSVENLKELARESHQRLLATYGRARWRTPLDPLDELISTILSQNTNDTNRDRAFHALRSRFPSWEDVRDGARAEVIETIRVAGLANQKGPRIQRVLREISAERGDLDLDFLRSYSPDEARDWLMRFKGVGPKTASIVMLFSLGLYAFPVDTHVYRVSGRLGLRPSGMNAEKAHQWLAGLFPRRAYRQVHLNIIRHGREICHARNPECPNCVLFDLCEFGQERVGTDASPARGNKAPRA